MRTMMTTILLAAATATAAYAAPLPVSPARTPPAAVTLTVQNNRSVPVTVFVDENDLDIRLGEVSAMRTATLVLPKWVSEAGNELQIFVHPEGGIDLNAQIYDVHPGAHLALEVPKGMNAPPQPAREMTATLPPNEMAATTVTVTNERDVEVVIYLENGDFDVRLGTVPASSTRTLSVPEQYAHGQQSIDLVVHPERGFDLESQTLDLRNGTHLGLRVPKK
jgi:anti-sigma-K factor RskA